MLFLKLLSLCCSLLLLLSLLVKVKIIVSSHPKTTLLIRLARKTQQQAKELQKYFYNIISSDRFIWKLPKV